MAVTKSFAWETVSTNAIANATTAGDQVNARVYARPDGGYVVLYEGSQFSVDTVRARVFNRDGVQVTPEFVVHSTTAGTQNQGECLVLADGKMVFAWRDTSDGEADIRARVFNADGTPFGAEIVIANSASVESAPVLSRGLTGSSFLVSWESGANSGDVLAASVNVNGTSASIITGFIGTGAQSAPSLAPIGAGLVAAQTSATTFSVRLGNTVLPDSVALTGTQPDVVALSGDSFALTYVSGGTVMLARYAINTATGVATIVSSTSLGSGSSPSISLAEGTVVVSYVDAGAIRVRALDLTTGLLSDAAVLGAASNADVAVLGDGRVVVVRDSAQSDGSGRSIRTDVIDLMTVQTSDGESDVVVGGSDRDRIIGGGGSDTLRGEAGDDQLYGDTVDGSGSGVADSLDGGAGADLMVGGGGDDTYVVDQVGDVVVEAAGGGVDEVRFTSTGSFVLAAEVENARALATGVTNLTGNALNNRFTSSVGSGQFDGAGGTDRVVYITSEAVTIDLADLSKNTGVAAGDSYVSIEEFQVVAPNAAVPGALTFFGSAGDDRVFGGDASDYLDGRGGADVMTGGEGNDVYVLDSAADQVVESINGGTHDEIRVTFDYTLISNVERLVGQGSVGLKLTGNSGDNLIVGTSGGDTLNGGGGSDMLEGGAGDDVYYLDGLSSGVVEGAGGGIDTIYFSNAFGMLFDNVEIGYLGAGSFFITGNALNNTLYGSDEGNSLDGGLGADVMVGGKGLDAYYVDNVGDVIVETADGGTDLVYTAIDWVLGDNVEHLYATGLNLKLTGNALNNILDGGAGADVLNGGAGVDQMSGGLGDDTYVLDVAQDAVLETEGGGFDTVYVGFSYSLGNQVERGYLTVGGQTLTGHSGGNVLGGSQGNDTLDGGGGADFMQGWTGDDVYVVDDIGDVVVEAAGEGLDTVQTSVSFILGANIENAQLVGSMGDGRKLTGNALDNTLQGTTSNDILDGSTGADVMSGDAGSDTYFVDNAGDVIDDQTGYDTVYSSVSYVMATGVDRGFLTVGGRTLTGNALNNVMGGSQGNDVLSGGAGTDFMQGWTGDDTYFVDNDEDAVVEAAGEGFDTVYAATTHTLSANVERGYLTVGGQTLTGNALGNVLGGSQGADVLNGGAGADYMEGWTGNDQYFVDNVLDAVVEAANGGSDTIWSSVSYTLSANVERGFLTVGGQTLTGNGLNNVMGGSQANDVLNGGVGADRMEGWTGDDTYFVDNAADQIVEAASDGYDTVYSSVSHTLAANVERGYLTTGGLTLTGNALGNVLGGSTGADTLIGGGGADLIEGGAGADVYRYLATSDSNGVVGRDVLNDFQVGIDKIDVSALRTGASDTFAWEDRGNGFFFLNVDLGGNGSTDLSIRVKGSGFTNNDVIWTAPANMPAPLSDEAAPQDLGASVFKPAPEDGFVSDVFVFTGPQADEITPEVFVGAPADTPVFDAGVDVWADTPAWTVGFDAQNGWITIDDGATGRPEKGWLWS